MTRRTFTVAALLAALVAIAAPALAYWTLRSAGSAGSYAAGSIAAPTGVATVHNTSDGGVTLSWTASTTTKVTSYDVQRAPVASGQCGTFASIANVAASPYTDSGAVYNTDYCYRVFALYKGWSTPAASLYAASVAVTAGSDSTSTTSTSAKGKVGAAAFTGVTAPAANAVYAVGTGIYKWNGTSWSNPASLPTTNFTGVDAFDSTKVWASTGGSSIAYTTDGSNWSTYNVPGSPSPSLKGITAADATHVYAIGGKKIYPVTFGGTSPNTGTVAGLTNNVNAISAVDNTHVWVVEDANTGSGGKAFVASYNGATGTVTESQLTGPTGNTKPNLYGVFSLDTTHVWAVGQAGAIFFFNGSAWSIQTSGVALDLTGVYASDGSHVWAVGAAGTVLQSLDGGATWTDISLSVSETADLKAISGSDSAHVWAVGGSGAVDTLAAATPKSLSTTDLSAVRSADGTTTYPTAGSWQKGALPATCPAQALVVSAPVVAPSGSTVTTMQAVLKLQASRGTSAFGRVFVSGDGGTTWAAAAADATLSTTSTSETFALANSWKSLASPDLSQLKLCFAAGTGSSSAGAPFTTTLDLFHLDVN